HHPDTASVIQNLGLVAYQRGEYAQALEHFDQTLEVYAAILRPDIVDMAQTRVNRANAVSYLERNEEALAEFARAKESYIETLGPRSGPVASILNTEAGIYQAQGELERARDTYR